MTNHQSADGARHQLWIGRRTILGLIASGAAVGVAGSAVTRTLGGRGSSDLTDTASTIAGVPARSDPPTAPHTSVPPPSKPDRVLVIVNQLGGGDGLNTVVPVNDQTYRSLRADLAINASDTLSIDDEVGMHPSLHHLHQRWNDGHVAILHGVGTPQSTMSHFTMGDLLQTGLSADRGTATGWVGRWLDTLAPSDEVTRAVSFSGGVPLLLRGARSSGDAMPTALASMTSSPNSLVQQPSFLALSEAYGAAQSSSNAQPDMAELLGRSCLGAVNMASSFGSLVPQHSPSRIEDSLTGAARLLNADIGIRVIYAHQDGYDTHAHQLPRHAQLLSSLDVALQRFWETLSARSKARAIVVVVSEFGRRVQANGSGGTDHGHANDWLIVGEPVIAGRYGARPSLTQLDANGNLPMTLDQNEVVSTLLEQWLESSPEQILGRRHRPLHLFA
jgi:uncharacterized protein (DUF1501 family)